MASPVQQDQALFPKLPEMPQLGGAAHSSLQRLLFPGRVEKFQVCPSTAMERTYCVLERKESSNIVGLPASTGTVC